MTRRECRGLLGWYDRQWRKRQVRRLARDFNLTPEQAEAKQREIERAVDALTAYARQLHEDLTGRRR